MNIKKITAAFLSFAVLAGGITCNEIYLKNEFAVSAVEESNEQLEDSTTLSITQVPDKLVYNIGEELDLTGGMAYAKGVYNGENWDTSNQPLDSEHFEIDASEFDNQESGTYSIYVTNTYGVPVTRVFVVRVLPNIIIEEPTFYISQAPVKSKYRIGEELDFTGGMVYSLDMGDCELPLDPKHFKIDASEFDNQTPGIYSIYVLDPNVSDMENDMNWDSFSVEVAEGGGDLHLSSLPDKLVYNIGEELDLTGGVAYASGSYNGAVWDTFWQPLDSECFYVDASEFNNQVPGVYNIYVSISDWICGTKSFEVEVVEKAVVTTTAPVIADNTIVYTSTTGQSYSTGSVSISKLPDKVVYNIGEELDFTGGTISGDGVVYQDGKVLSRWHIYGEIANYTIDSSDFNNQKPGAYTIRVKTPQGSTSFTVTVVRGDNSTTTTTTTTSDDNYTSIGMNKLPDKLVYNIGEELDFTGGSATAQGLYNGVNWDTFNQPITSEYFEIDSSEFDNQTPGIYTIYVFNATGKRACTSFEVEVIGESYPEVIYGDANCDGVVDIADIAIVKCYLINSEKYSMTSKGLKNADVQGNENGINVNDAIAIQKYVLGMIDSFSE